MAPIFEFTSNKTYCVPPCSILFSINFDYTSEACSSFELTIDFGDTKTQTLSASKAKWNGSINHAYSVEGTFIVTCYLVLKSCSSTRRIYKQKSIQITTSRISQPVPQPCLYGTLKCVKWDSAGNCMKAECILDGGESEPPPTNNPPSKPQLPIAPPPPPALPIPDFRYKEYADRWVKLIDTVLNTYSKLVWIIYDDVNNPLIIEERTPYIQMRGVLASIEVTLIGYNTSLESASITKTITVSSPVKQVAFTYVIKGRFVHFINDSTIPTTSWLWSFGDGGTSIEENPVWLYNAYGTYTVTLTSGGYTYSTEIELSMALEKIGNENFATDAYTAFFTKDDDIYIPFAGADPYPLSIDKSVDNGANFSDTASGFNFVNWEGYDHMFEGQVLFDRITGYMHEIYWDSTDFKIRVSDDGGDTWDAPITTGLITILSSNRDNLYGLHVDNGVYHILKIASGNLTHYSSSDGSTWSAAHSITSDVLCELLAISPLTFYSVHHMGDASLYNISGDTHVFIFLKDIDCVGDLYIAISLDAGVTWTTQVILEEADIDFMYLLYYAVSCEGLNICLFYNDATGVYLKFSDDGGVTWGDVITVITTLDYPSYPYKVIIDTGVIYLINLITEDVDADHTQTIYSIIKSEDNGVTWTTIYTRTIINKTTYPIPEEDALYLIQWSHLQINDDKLYCMVVEMTNPAPGDGSITPFIYVIDTDGGSGEGSGEGSDEEFQALFFISVDEATSTISVTNVSTGGISGVDYTCLWEWGDGTTSTDCDPDPHTYTQPGVYTIRFTITDANGITSTVKHIVTIPYTDTNRGSGFKTYVPIIVPPPIASFTVDVQTGNAPLTVTFTDTSQGVISARVWNFGDGGTSAAEDPTHEFSSSGTYTVILTVLGEGGFTSVASIQIVVNTAGGIGNALPLAAFTCTPVYGRSPLTVVFTNGSSGTIVSYEWNFGDGTLSTEENPIHVFTGTGKKIVTLTVTNTVGSTRAIAEIVLIQVPLIITKKRRGYYYIIDTENDLVWVYDLDGVYVKTFGGSGNANGLLNNPTSLSVIGGVEYLDKIILNDLTRS